MFELTNLKPAHPNELLADIVGSQFDNSSILQFVNL